MSAVRAVLAAAASVRPIAPPREGASSSAAPPRRRWAKGGVSARSRDRSAGSDRRPAVHAETPGGTSRVTAFREGEDLGMAGRRMDVETCVALGAARAGGPT